MQLVHLGAGAGFPAVLGEVGAALPVVWGVAAKSPDDLDPLVKSRISASGNAVGAFHPLPAN